MEHSPAPFALTPSGTLIRDANFQTVAILPFRTENMADAMLFIAAPKMLEALEALEPEVAGMVHAFPHWEPFLCNIRAAIGAATVTKDHHVTR